MRTTFFLFTTFVLATTFAAAAEVYHVDPDKGNDQAEGSAEKPFRTAAKALNLLAGKGGEIHLAPGCVLRESIPMIRKSGLPDNPIVLDGHGAVINLGTDITAGPWTKTGDEYRYENEVPKHRTHYGTSVIFINGWPIYCDHPNGRGQKARHGGSIRYDENGKLIVRFPRGLDPGNSVIVLTGKTDSHSGLLVNGSSNVIVKNLTVVFAGNDGFNMHGHGENFRLENVTALFNGDEGISAHETYRVDVKNSEVAFSGSLDGGIADVNDSETTYESVRVHQNRTVGFKLIGVKHSVKNCVAYGNPGGDMPKPSEKVTVENCRVEEFAETVSAEEGVPVYSGQTAPASAAEIKESDRMTRFLFYRPKPAE